MILHDYIIDKFNKQIETVPESWIISDGLRDKVSEKATYRPFYGYTSVFHLSEDEQKECSSILDKVLASSSDMLIPLPVSSFHITAHEFANEYTVSNRRDEIDKSNYEVLESIGALFHELNEEYDGRKISMRALGPSTSGSDVVSIKFIPSTKDDEAILETVFNKSEDIWPIGRKYMPHVSLGYFRTEVFAQDKVIALYDNLKAIRTNLDLHVTFSVRDLVYQRHFSMEDFRDLFSVADMNGDWRNRCRASVNI